MINKIDKPLDKLTKKNTDRTQINIIRKEREEITIDIKESFKNHKRILQRVTCRHIGQPRRNR